MRLRLPLTVLVGALFAALLAAAPADAGLLITIDKAQQRMIVARDDMPLHDWPVSTGVSGYDTPAGLFKPFRMEIDHYSREWDDAPMPHSIFFTQIGHAIHGSFEVKKLGRPASHGCVRLHPAHAEILFRLVRAEKMASTRVVLTGTIPGGPGVVKSVLGVDPYAADEGIVAWARPMPTLADIKTLPPAGRVRTKPRRAAPRYYYYDQRPRRGFPDLLFGR